MSARGPYRIRERTNASSVHFTFDGRALQGVAGDTLASALLANGVRTVARSFKFHRPRGIYSAGFEEPNALVQLGSGARTVPSARATLVSLREGLEARSQTGWPSVRTDLCRAIDFLHPVFAAGFYNKTFIWPSWKTYESIIRALAGLGRAPDAPDPDRYETRHAQCDVLVVGGGAAGVEAAGKAAAAGQRVILVELGAVLGGDVSSANGSREVTIARLCAQPRVQLLLRTAAIAYYDNDLVALVETVEDSTTHVRERLWLVRAKKVVLATGAVEQPLVFDNNDRPGIQLAGAARRYLHDHGIAPGRRIVIATNNDSAYTVAQDLHAAGAKVLALLDTRATPPAELAAPLRSAGIAIHAQSMPIDTAGFSGLKSVKVARLPGGSGATETIACDALLLSGGWSPVLHLFAQAGGKLAFSERSQSYEPVAPLPNIEIVGKAAVPAKGTLGPRLSPVGKPARQWIDLLHDVTVADVNLALRENFTSMEHIKRYTTLGMAADQGKTAQAVGADAVARARGLRPSQLPHTTFRPPFMPTTIGALVGRHTGTLYAPQRRTELHTLQEQAGAVFEDFGEWKRAAAFPRAGESHHAAIHREIQLVRNGVGLFDASPLGKIELIGPDALEFADRFYINNLSTLKPLRARYGIMLHENGIVFDDGTVTMLGPDHLLLTTTSGGAGRVGAWFEEWRQCEWPQLRVAVVPVTDQWSTVALTGQHARALLERLKPECDISNEALPHLSVRPTRLLGSDARIYRVSFTGELTYEINVPAHKGPELWSALMEEGRALGIAPYGIEALLHLRMEKGFLHIGSETDGTTVPDDIGWGKPAANKQSHYIGKRSLALLENVRADRLQLVGVAGAGGPGSRVGRGAGTLASQGASRSGGTRAGHGPGTSFPSGCHLRLPGSDAPSDGWVTSAGALSTDGSPVGMALLRTGRSQMGKTVDVYDGGRRITTAKIVNPCFYDAAGERMNA